MGPSALVPASQSRRLWEQHGGAGRLRLCSIARIAIIVELPAPGMGRGRKSKRSTLSSNDNAAPANTHTFRGDVIENDNSPFQC